MPLPTVRNFSRIDYVWGAPRRRECGPGDEKSKKSRARWSRGRLLGAQANFPGDMLMG
jgi:hypothetical protein